MSTLHILATLCSIATGVCHEQQITNSGYQPSLTSKACQVGMPQLAAFMRNWPQYELRGWRCVPDGAPVKEHA